MKEEETFVPHHRLLTARPHLIQAPGLLMERAQFLGHEPTVCPSPQARIKAIYVFPPHSVSVFFIWLWWAGKAKILASNMPCVESSESSPLDRQGSPSLVFLLQVALTFRALYILGITQSFLVLLFPSPPPLLPSLPFLVCYLFIFFRL